MQEQRILIFYIIKPYETYTFKGFSIFKNEKKPKKSIFLFYKILGYSNKLILKKIYLNFRESLAET